MRKKLLKSLVLVGAMMMFSMSAMAADGDVEINADNFPDEVFREYVSENFDTDENDVLSQTELDAVTEIYIADGKQIISVEGIEYFSNLTYLLCGETGITSLDVSNNTELVTLLCWDTEIISLDVSNNTKLTWLNCSETEIAKLDVSSNTELEQLSCSATGITSLDVSNNTKLVSLFCGETGITSLDVSYNIELQILSFSYTGITSLDISKNTELVELNCFATGITSLDTSNNTKLETLLWDGEDSSDGSDDVNSNEVTNDDAQALVDKENLVVETDSNMIIFSQGAIDIIADSSAKTLSVTMGDVELVLDSTTLQSIQEQISGDVTFVAEYIETEQLPDEYLAIVGDRPVYVFSIFDDDGNIVSDFEGGSITVTVPYTLSDDETADNLVIYYMLDGEILETFAIDSYDAENELLTFTTTHFSTYAVGYEGDADTDGNEDTDDTTTDDTDTTTDDAPETGDTSNIMLYMMLAALAFSGIVVVTKRRMA